MEDQTTRATILTISELIDRSCPLTGASSLNPSSPIPAQHSHPKKPPVLDSQTPIAKTLKPLNAFLVGVLTLPSFDDTKPSIRCSCFQFSDGSAAVCCDILDFDPNMIGRKVRILAWNFIPCGGRGGKGGFLEIIRWAFLSSCSEYENVCCLSDFSSFCLSLGSCNSLKASKGSVFGVVESISPVCVVPCASGGKGSKSICGFLVNVFVCVCELCRSKVLVSQLSGLSERNVEDHSFVKRLVLYFCGMASSWHPVITRLIGCVVLVRGLKKKDVFLVKDNSQLMYVTTEAVALHVLKSSPKWNLIRDNDIEGKSDSYSYTGVITGVYMQGMVVELDRDVMLLLTDQYPTLQHCMRVGAIVTLRNVHFLDPKFSWGKISILGACYRTSMYMESFSPLQTGYYSKSHSESLLQKFIDSLSFSARLWVLLVISCFRKKFAGILSEKEFLGSKHKEGLVQKFASKYLPQSAFQSRVWQHGVLVEFCKHDLCPRGDGLDYGKLRLVLPISNLISYCEVSWKKILDDWENCDDFSCSASQEKPLSCNERSHTQSIRRVLRVEEKGVLALGVLKISLSSGRLQLVDATGVIDIVLDLQATWDFKSIFEAKDFMVIMEGAPQKLVDLSSFVHPLSCKSIFSNEPLVRKTKTSLYLYHDPRAKDSRRRSLFFDFKEYEIGSGIFHLLMLTRKYPIQQKFQEDPNLFAEAIILPWNLLVSGKHEDAVMTGLSLDHLRGSVEKFIKFERHHKRCKIDEASTETSCIKSRRESISCASLELPCLIGRKGVNCHWGGILRGTSEHVNIVFDCKTPRKKLLLEFDPESFCMYQALKIGLCYLVKHEEDKLCSSKENHAKIFIDSGTQFWSFRFSSIEGLPSSDASDVSQFHNHIGHEIDSDINLSVPSDVLNSLENVIKVMGSISTKPTPPFGEKGDIVDAPMQFARSSCSDFPLPVGNLISLDGLVVTLHDCTDDAFPAKQKLIPGEGCWPKFLQGNGGVCIHVLVDNCMVQIFSDPSKHAYPIGFGRDVHATFHRILELSGQHKYMMTPVSFITISHGSLMNEQQSDKFNDKAETVCLPRFASPDTVPRVMISDLLQLSEFKPVQFHCRVVAVYIFVVERSRTSAVFQLSRHSIPSVVSIPFAGFIVDDGSSSCCCWADSGRAAALLGLDSEASPITSERCKILSGLPYSSTVPRLNQILEKHGRIVVKNYGSMFESLSQDLSFVVGSNKPICSSDEDHLRNLISNASFSTFLTVVGGRMDPNATKQLEERLMESHIAIPPLLNVWATSVCHTDMLAEARNIFEDLKICC